MYDRAIDYDRSDARIWNNRAVARMQLEKYEEALSDARQAITLDRLYQKGYLRACEALTHLRRFEVPNE
jgi:tetratricopeptide (TPR) repeat protein